MPRKKAQKVEGPKRIVFYIRISSLKQDLENSKEGQMAALEKYTAQVGGVCVGVYIDEAISGRRDDRPELNRLMRDGRNRDRPFDVCAIWKVDRFGRRASTIDRRATELEALGIEVVAVAQPIQGKPSAVRFFRNLMGNVAEYFSDNMGEDIARGRRTSAGHGVWTNSSIPFGFRREYRMDRNRMRPFLVPDPETAPTMARMNTMYREGIGVKKIAKVFRDEGVTGPNDKPWTARRVLNMLKNIAPAGFIKYGERSKLDDEVLLVPVPEMEIITLEDYDRAQEIMASHRPEQRHPREVASVHMLAGLVYCDYCGAKMSPTGGIRCYYNCNSKRKDLSPSCDTPRPRAEILDAAVLEHILKKVVTPENTEQLIRTVEQGRSETTIEVEEDLRNLEMEIGNQKEGRKALLGLVERRQAVEGDIAERLGEIRETLTK